MLLGRLVPGRRFLGGAAAALLLMPMPAMALTFLGSWTPSISVSGGPTPPTPTFTDSVTNNGGKAEDVLNVFMGDYQGQTATANSSITLTRQFDITNPAQVLQFQHNATTMLSQAGENVTLQVKNGAGQVLFTPVNFAFSTNSTTFVSVQDSELYRTALSMNPATQHYMLVANVTFNTNNKVGGWKTKSAAHVFDIQGF
jgi:hypothetical protein